MSDLALLERRGRIATLTLNRPDARNALSLELLTALHERADELARDAESTVCVVRGAGPSFCAGMDLKAVIDIPGAPARLLSLIAELTLKLRALPMVTIAAVQGAAIGGGCGLMCVCDLAYTHPEAKVGFPEVDLGVCPAVVAPWLALKIGPGRARRVLLEAGTLSGQRAHELGLATALAPTREAVESLATDTAERLASAGPIALRATKQWLNHADGEQLAAQVRRGAVVSAEVVQGPEAQERLRAAFGRPAAGGRA